MDTYDLVVIGSGAGLIVAEQAVEHGRRCALVERAKMGGTCLTKGCIPSKMLVFPADYIRETERADRFGVKARQPDIDWNTIAARMWEQINFSDTIRKNFEKLDNLTLYSGTGSFIDPYTLVIRYGGEKPDDIIKGKQFIIAAGARSFVPEIEGLEEAGYLTSERFFTDRFPHAPWKHLALYGGGSISLEFAHIFSAYGSKVTIIERSGRVLKKEDEDISAFVTRQLLRNGVEIITDGSIDQVKTEGTQKYVRVKGPTGTYRDIVCDELFIASGIRSNADSLALGRAGVAADARGWIMTNAYLETSKPHIFAIGDINGKTQLRHKANYEAQLLCDNLFKNKQRIPADYNAIPRAVFTCPQIAGVGFTESELKEKGIAYRSAVQRYSDVVAGRAMGYRGEDDDDGFVKALVGEDDRILGAHIAGPQAAALIQPYVNLMRTGGTYDAVLDSLVIHPSLNELTAWVFEYME